MKGSERERKFKVARRSAYSLECSTSQFNTPNQSFPIRNLNLELQPAIDETEHEDRVKGLKLRNVLSKALRRFKGLIVSGEIERESLKEEWQRQPDEEEQGAVSQCLLVQLNPIYFLSQLLFLLVHICVVWCWSVDNVMELNMNMLPVTLTCIVAVLLDATFSLNTALVEKGREVRNRPTILRRYVQWRVYIDVLLIVVSVSHNMTPRNDIVDFIAIVLLLAKLYQHSENIKPFIDIIFRKQHVTLFGSFALLLGIMHVFGLMLFSVSRADQRNWLNSVKIDHEAWDVQYIYSIYWAITTIVTVGYGDITPQNKYEVLVVIFVEIIGTSIFGYMINVIGMSLTEMKRERQTLDNELSVADKICKCFNISSDLAYRVKNYLSNNHKVDRSFSLQEEAQVIDKLNPMLRNEIIKDTNSKVIRKSLFFLTHFTWNAQIRISLKLLKKVVQPTEVLLGDGSMYIIDRGELAIQLIRNHRSRIFAKCIKIISGGIESKNNGIGKNAYGYASTITGRRSNTNAVSRCFTIAFELRRKDLLDALQSGSMQDYESLCELRDRFNEYERVETIEAPELADPRLHYQPNKSIVPMIQSQLSIPRKRKPHFKRSSLSRFNALSFVHTMPKFINSEERSADEQEGSHYAAEDEMFRKSTHHLTSVFPPHDPFPLNNNTETTNGMLNMTQFNPLKVTIEDHVSHENYVLYLTDLVKSYENYRPSSNLEQLIRKYNRKLRTNKYFKRNMKSFDTL